MCDSISEDPLPYLKPHTLVLPPGFEVKNGVISSIKGFNNRSIELSDTTESGLIAIDIAILPSKSIENKVITEFNTPMVENANSFKFDSSHHPHMTLIHTFIHAHTLPSVCRTMETLCSNAPQVIKQWNGVAIDENIDTTNPTLTSNPPPTSESMGSLPSIPLSFLSAGPEWDGDNHLPYIATPNNPLFNTNIDTEADSYNIRGPTKTSSLFPRDIPVDTPSVNIDGSRLVRAFHDVVCTVLQPLRQTPFPHAEDRVGGVVQRSVVLREQGCYYTGGPLTATTAAVTHNIDGVDVVEGAVADAGSTATSGGCAVYSPLSSEAVRVEVVSANSMEYSDAFDTIGRGTKYNPHITLGSGSPEPVFAILNEAACRLTGSSPVVRNEDDFYPPIPLSSNLHMPFYYVVIFQLGDNGACRFPLYKTYMNWKE